MRRNPLAKTKQRKKPKFYPYKSGLEKNVADKLSKKYDYEDKNLKCPYRVERTYQPDFTLEDKPWLIIEVKGFFNKRSNDALKYRSIKDSNPDKRIVFIFSNPNKKYGAKRKDGTAMTYAEWCVKYGFFYCSADNIPPALKRGDITKEWIDKKIKEQSRS